MTIMEIPLITELNTNDQFISGIVEFVSEVVLEFDVVVEVVSIRRLGSAA